jgi:hypothetical protein
MTDPFATVAPAYGSASLADILPSALAVLGVPGEPDPLGLRAELDGVRRIAVLLLDGLGWHQLPAAAAVSPTIRDVIAGRLGHARPLTSGFPSTTPTSLVTLGTGAAPGAHGIVGFTLNVPGTERVLNHLRWTDDPDPLLWQPLPTRFDRAAAAGISTTVVNRAEFAGSGLSVSAYRGATLRPASEVDELATGVLDALTTTEPPSLVYGYLPDVDKAGHEAGLDSELWRGAAGRADRLLTRLVAGLPADAALLVTADHGQVDIPPEYRIDLDLDDRLRTGVAVVAGEPRVRYLHTIAGATEDVLAAWRGVLGTAAWVASREEAVAGGWFGPVREEHLARVGDVVVVCHGRHAVFASAHEPARVASLIAYHGSYTAAEMQIPLLVFRGTVAGRG